LTYVNGGQTTWMPNIIAEIFKRICLLRFN